VVKDFYEPYTDAVRRRFSGLSSLKMTRLAAAIRHTAGKLQQVNAAVKLLFILSDGRPFDMDYKPLEQGEATVKSWLMQDDSVYPQADTKVALWEAKANGITPFCLTVDKRAKEYMEQIFSQLGYVLINDVGMLPVKLPEIYRRLTTI
jgi:nitric oxide reductase activation protein